MRAGEFPDGAHVLRAKIDLSSQNMNLRDPNLYRIRYAHHHRTGDKWCIYPMYDYAHPLSDAIEQITHSICTLEFEAHRPLYDWCIREAGEFPSQQIEFARLNLTYTVMSKRKLLQLVQQKLVTGWDDPRMPTITGLRRRGYTPEAIRDFCQRIGIAKKENVIDVAQLEFCIREDLNKHAPRVMVVLRPVKVVLTNYPEGQVEEVDVINNPEDASAGTRKVPFSRVLYIERDDFREVPPKKFFRLSPGREVRLRCAYFITCTEVVKDDRGDIVELRCTYDPATRGGDSPDGRRVKATMHWVSAAHALPAEVRLYDRLFSVEDPERDDAGKTFVDHLNPHSLEVLTHCQIEPSLVSAQAGARFQFERLGYEPKLIDLVHRLRDYVNFDGRKVLYTWIGGTRRDWRGQGHFRALTEQQEAWAIEQGFDEIVVKTKNKFYEMRGTLDHLRFEVVKYERNASDNAESKVYLSKKLHPEVLRRHRSARTVVQVTIRGPCL